MPGCCSAFRAGTRSAMALLHGARRRGIFMRTGWPIWRQKDRERSRAPQPSPGGRPWAFEVARMRDDREALGDPLGYSAALFPSEQARAPWDDFLSRELASANRRVAEGVVTPTLARSSIERALAEFDFQSPRPLGELLSWVIAQLEHGVVH